MDKEATIGFEEVRSWAYDFYRMYWSQPETEDGVRENLYLVLQYLERKVSVLVPTTDKVITRRLIEDEYDLIGYSSIQINNQDGTLRYGTYILELFKGPILVEDLQEDKRDPSKLLKIQLRPPGLK